MDELERLRARVAELEQAIADEHARLADRDLEWAKAVREVSQTLVGEMHLDDSDDPEGIRLNPRS